MKLTKRVTTLGELELNTGHVAIMLSDGVDSRRWLIDSDGRYARVQAELLVID